MSESWEISRCRASTIVAPTTPNALCINRPTMEPWQTVLAKKEAIDTGTSESSRIPCYINRLRRGSNQRRMRVISHFQAFGKLNPRP